MYSSNYGGKLKETGTLHWQTPNTDATDEFGFTGLPGGLVTNWGRFMNVNGDANWWSSSIHSLGAYRCYISYYGVILLDQQNRNS